MGERILTQVREDKNKLQDSHTKLGEELKDVRAQLDDSVRENKRLRGSIFGMYQTYLCVIRRGKELTDLCL